MDVIEGTYHVVYLSPICMDTLFFILAFILSCVHNSIV